MSNTLQEDLRHFYVTMWTNMHVKLALFQGVLKFVVFINFYKVLQFLVLYKYHITFTFTFTFSYLYIICFYSPCGKLLNHDSMYPSQL